MLSVLHTVRILVIILVKYGYMHSKAPAIFCQNTD